MPDDGVSIAARGLPSSLEDAPLIHVMPTPDQPAGPADASRPTTAPPDVKPGDEAPAGSTGTGENVCRRCGGTGKLPEAACPECKGTGVVTVVIGGA